MKTSLLTVATLLSACLLSACTGMDKKSSNVAPKQVDYPHGIKVETDSAYIAHVESIARRRGISVQWVNLPSKRTVIDGR